MKKDCFTANNMNEGKSTRGDELPLVSVIIPVFNDARRLRRCLEAVSCQEYPKSRYEVIVADNGSTDELREVMAQFPEVKFCEEPLRSSYAARNRGIAQARGGVFAFTDSDCIPAADWIAQGVIAIQAGEGIAGVAGRIEIFPQNSKKPTPMELYELLFAFPQETYVRQRGYGATANLFTTRAVMARVGVFDGRLTSGGDREWGQRATRAGARIAYSAAVVVKHPARPSWRQWRIKALRIRDAQRARGMSLSIWWWGKSGASVLLTQVLGVIRARRLGPRQRLEALAATLCVCAYRLWIMIPLIRPRSRSGRSAP